MFRQKTRLSVGEVFGLVSIEAVQQGLRGLRGDPTTPKHIWGLSTLKILQPVTSIRTWLKIRRPDKRIPIYNYFNRTPVSQELGYSIRRTQAQDFRGGTLTYDSHQGTDFIIPVCTPVVIAAPGVVIRVAREFDRGGLSIMVLHAHGLVTTYNHLGRPLVEVGQVVDRGETIALSGASGIDFVASFFLSPPHVHFNTWLNGTTIDPFAADGEVSLWLNGNNPLPHLSTSKKVTHFDVDSLFSKQAVERVINDCCDPRLESKLRNISWLPERAANVMYQRNYRPSKFKNFESLYLQEHQRTSHLDLPFKAEDATGVHFD